jgi:hypothetical protein
VLHVRIDCLEVSGTTAVATGTVDVQKLPPGAPFDPDGIYAVFAVQDNGEGAGSAPDRITTLSPAMGPCTGSLTPYHDIEPATSRSGASTPGGYSRRSGLSVGRPFRLPSRPDHSEPLVPTWSRGGVPVAPYAGHSGAGVAGGDRGRTPERALSPPAVGTPIARGGGRESNPPGSFRPLTGFEDRGAHQAP